MKHYKAIVRYAGILLVVTPLFSSRQAFAQAPKIVTSPQSYTVCAGGTARLEVTATGGLPLTYRWFRGMVTYTNITLNQTSCTLLLPNVTDSTAGVYWVQVSNASGADSSHFAYLAVMDPGMETNGFALTIRATTNTTWRIDCTTNLVGGSNWFTLTNIVIPGNWSSIRFVDLEGTNRSRLYRVVPTIY